MTTEKTKAFQLTRSGEQVIVDKVLPRRRPPGPAQPHSADQTKAIQNAPDRPVADKTIPTTPKTADGVVPEITSATPKPAGVNSPLGFHPMAEIFQLLNNEGLKALADDIAEHGLLDEIILLDGKILDGRCRYLACERVGVSPKFHDYVGDDPLGFVISRNVHRRHLTKTQSAFAAARAATLPVGANQNTPGLPIGRKRRRRLAPPVPGPEKLSSRHCSNQRLPHTRRRLRRTLRTPRLHRPQFPKSRNLKSAMTVRSTPINMSGQMKRSPFWRH